MNITDDTIVVFNGTAVTRAPSGSFDLDLVIRNLAGNDVVVARAANPLTGETCRATATFQAIASRPSTGSPSRSTD